MHTASRLKRCFAMKSYYKQYQMRAERRIISWEARLLVSLQAAIGFHPPRSCWPTYLATCIAELLSFQLQCSGQRLLLRTRIRRCLDKSSLLRWQSCLYLLANLSCNQQVLRPIGLNHVPWATQSHESDSDLDFWWSIAPCWYQVPSFPAYRNSR